MRIKLLLIFLLLFKYSPSQTLIPEALKVKIAYRNLSSDTNSENLKRFYVSSFPSDTKTFLKVFQSKKFDQLYMDSYKYLEAFKKCATTFPIQVINKCVDIGKNLVWDADAVGQLQQMSVRLAIKHVTIFVNKYKTLDNKAQGQLIRFYADVENYKAYPEFQELIDKLKNMREIDIAKKLDRARIFRKGKHDH